MRRDFLDHLQVSKDGLSSGFKEEISSSSFSPTIAGYDGI